MNLGCYDGLCGEMIDIELSIEEIFREMTYEDCINMAATLEKEEFFNGALRVDTLDDEFKLEVIKKYWNEYDAAEFKRRLK